MCGIAGIHHFEPQRPVDEGLLREITQKLDHRGPDGEGYYCEGNVGLGHRRLSIIDLETGDQPMYSADKSLVLVFNGEIYNYIELREELKSVGCEFKTDSDSEVILMAYSAWGTECQNRFIGMWAFALWDNKRKSLFISRDRVGEKPLFYTVYQNTFIFASEIKSLLAYGVPTEPNEQVLELYLSLGYIPAPHTYYKNIHKLLPGNYMVVADGSFKNYQYWDLPELDEANMRDDKKEVYGKFESLLMDSVKIQMRSDVPYGAFLSGGLDSSSAVALMSEISSKPIETFTIGFEDKAFDERELASQVASKFNTNHHETIVEPDSLEQYLDKVLYHYDEPFGDPSAIPTGYVSEFAAQNVKMALTGDGGDELLSGYSTYQGEKFSRQFQAVPSFIRSGIASSLQIVSPLFKNKNRYKLNRYKRVVNAANLDFNERLASKVSRLERDNIRKLLGNSTGRISLEEYINDLMAKCPYQDWFYKMMYFHFKVSLPNDMLVKVDRMSMAHSLETRCPFLDYRLIEFMVGVSKDVKMEGYEKKSILKNTVGKRLPVSILNATKKGFAVPLREWFKGGAFDRQLNGLYEDNSTFAGSHNVIKKIVADNRKGASDYGSFIWSFMVLKKWMDK